MKNKLKDLLKAKSYKLKANSKGFTLIELLVVIAIIGILSSVVLASLNSARQKSRDAKRISDVKQIQLALELYADSNGSEYADTVAAVVAAGFMPSEPKDPSTAASYAYDNVTSAGAACAVLTGVCNFYHLGTDLEQNGTGATGVGGHAVLGSDADNAYTFNGAGADCAAVGTDDGCYDVTP